ncbi:hypothetical protein AMJ40_06880 [candidate division TA06 bacterium DG_26]|uniref:Uncharacterized protein n=1 Tax=candidate division TA06 bacterium DG_26 TaxID=1703771 RepID=A0A0S7WF84_UNCT6|nr:MAG: hypothetical protein AMJ40_06880 [candidate division TA06 bacterium DG_26]
MSVGSSLSGGTNGFMMLAVTLCAHMRPFSSTTIAYARSWLSLTRSLTNAFKRSSFGLMR